MIRLRELREARDLSVKDMCRKLGVDDSRYRKWESGKNGLPLEYSLMCCDILHCSLDELSGRTAAIEYDSSAALSDDERRLLELYRGCGARGREYLTQMAEVTAGIFGRE